MEVLEKTNSSNPTKLNGNNRIPTLSFMYTDKSSSSTDHCEGEENMHDELKNIQSVMCLCRENIDALNKKFANLQNPPSMYINEFEELTSKLHELESKEHELMERLQQNEIEPPDHTEYQEEVCNCFFCKFFTFTIDNSTLRCCYGLLWNASNESVNQQFY